MINETWKCLLTIVLKNIYHPNMIGTLFFGSSVLRTILKTTKNVIKVYLLR